MTCPACNAVNEPGAEVCFTCGHVVAAPITKGTVFGGRYEVLSLIGRGGMGAVYRARDRVLGDKVALKVMRTDLSSKPEMIRRFGSEMALVRKVRHPNVCRIFGSGQENGRLWLCMELVEGEELRTLLRRQRIEAEQAFEWGAQVANGLQALHEVGLVHRDVKALNVMVDGKGVARLMDLDIAKQWEQEASGATATGQVLGTPEYISPEYAKGLPVDARSDIYSLGVLVYELFTGQVPFRGDSPVAVIMKHIHESPPLEGPRAPGLPPQVVPILKKALAKKPELRYSTARGMAVALGVARNAARGPQLPPSHVPHEPLPALLEALNPLDKTIRIPAPKAPDPAAPKAIPVLIHALADPSRPADDTIPPAIPPGETPKETEPIAVLIQALRAPDKHDRARAARVLGGIGADARAAIPVLLEVLRDREAIVRFDAAKALEKMGDAAREALSEALQDDDEVVRRIAAEALARIIRRKREMSR
jgi:serine/threonine protein kinase